MRPAIGLTCSLTVTAIEGTMYFSERNQVSRDYARAIEYVGGTPLLLPHVEDSECIDHYLGLLDGLLLSGGGDIDPLLFGQEPHQKIGSVDRLRDEMELQLTRKALDQDLPIFATCRGIQVLSVAADGNGVPGYCLRDGPANFVPYAERPRVGTLRIQSISFPAVACIKSSAAQ